MTFPTIKPSIVFGSATLTILLLSGCSTAPETSNWGTAETSSPVPPETVEATPSGTIKQGDPNPNAYDCGATPINEAEEVAAMLCNLPKNPTAYLSEYNLTKDNADQLLQELKNSVFTSYPISWESDKDRDAGYINVDIRNTKGQLQSVEIGLAYEKGEWKFDTYNPYQESLAPGYTKEEEANSFLENDVFYTERKMVESSSEENPTDVEPYQVHLTSSIVVEGTWDDYKIIGTSTLNGDQYIYDSATGTHTAHKS